MSFRPQCGYRYLVCDETGEPVSVWSSLGEARSSLIHNNKPGWCVKHEGTGQILAGSLADTKVDNLSKP